jgi:hypothetical protein
MAATLSSAFVDIVLRHAEHQRTHTRSTPEQIIDGAMFNARVRGVVFKPWTAEGAARFLGARSRAARRRTPRGRRR